MHARQFCTPHLVNTEGATPLERVVFDDRSISEGWFQDLLFKNPSLIPIDEIEEVFGPLFPVARELPTQAGAVDVVYINPRGYITLVETKLFRNPESRREVVAQILDYASAMSGWTYQDLCNAVRLKRRNDDGRPTGPSTPIENSDDPILPLLRDHPDFDEARFIDDVTRNLAQGRFLLLIVGDGIQRGVEQLADTLSAAPALGFTFALLEIALFNTGTPGQAMVAQPRVLARTREIVRAVVELRAPLAPKDVTVKLPEVVFGDDGGKRRRLTEEAMFDTITESLGTAVVEQFRGFLRECEKVGIDAEARGASLSLVWYEPNTGTRFSFASIYAEGGVVDLRYVLHNYRKSGIDQMIGREYMNAVAALVPGAKVRENFKDGKAWPRVVVEQRPITLADLMPKSNEWLKALADVIAKTESGRANGAENS
ncbi:MAG: hypothetical protein SF069_06410 [Phycisphaerae bacterium]|nr:hypothetical protein [Phycisphaerae bacterium]